MLKQHLLRFTCWLAIAVLLPREPVHAQGRPPRARQTPVSTRTAAHWDINGQVFIVTEGAESIKLGLVTIAIVSEDAALRHVAVKDSLAKIAQEPLRPALDSARTDYFEAKATLDSLRHLMTTEIAEHEAAAARIRESHDGARKKARLLQDIVDLMSQRMSQSRAAIAAYESVKLRYAVLVAQYYYWSSGDYVFEGMPTAIVSTQTDADGKFALRIPSNSRYALTARAERRIGDKREKYFWLIRLTDAARAGTPVLLANETLTTGHSEQSLVHTEEPEELEKDGGPSSPAR